MRAAQTFYILFTQELKMLWRNELGNPKWRLWRRAFIASLLIITLAVILYRLFLSPSVPDIREFLMLGFIILIYIWSSLNVLNLFRDSANYHLLALTPLSGITYTFVRFSAHWFYHTTLLLLIAFPLLLNLIFGGYIKLLEGLLVLYLIALLIVSLAWLVVLTIVHWWGVEGARKFIKATSIIVFVLLWQGLLSNVEAIGYLIGWWRDSAVTFSHLIMIILTVAFFVSIAVWLMAVVIKKPIKSVKAAGGGTKLLGNEGFRALLIKEYRLLYRSSIKMILFLLGNYAISISMVWIMFRVTQPNELYFFVSFVMFLFFIYPAAPNNMQTSKEETFWPMLFISPTAVRDVLMAKSIAVYSLITPITLLIGFSILSYIGLESGHIVLTLFMGLIVGSVSVWTGAIETLMRLTGRSFWARFKVSALSFVGSIIIFSVIYFVKELHLIPLLIWFSIAVLSYSISICWSLSFCKNIFLKTRKYKLL